MKLPNSSVFLLSFLLLFAFDMSGQSLRLNSSDLKLNGLAHANDYLVPWNDPLAPVIFDEDRCDYNGPLIANVMGANYAYNCGREVSESFQFFTYTSSYVHGWFSITGDNTSTVTIQWTLATHPYTLSREGYEAWAWLNANLDLDFEITGVGPGQNLNLFFSYDAFSAATTEHESGDEDSVRVSPELFLENTELYSDAGFNMEFRNPPGASGWNRILGQNGTLNVNSSDIIDVVINGVLHAYIYELGVPYGFARILDESNAIWTGTLRLGLSPLIPPVSYTLDTTDLPLFSVDIGSDAEFSDPGSLGNEVFDPGDAYPIIGPGGAFLPAGGRDGIIDDSLFFDLDVWPDAPDAANLTAAPVLSGQPPNTVIADWHDMDGLDNINTDLIAANRSTLLTDPCVFPPTYMFISYDDDSAGHYTGAAPPTLPVTSGSPINGGTRGTTAGKDEVIEVLYSAVPPLQPLFQNPLWAESDIHPNLAPNPDATEAHDDDLDALDLSYEQSVCPLTYVSVDHEATGFDFNNPSFDPGAIYLLSGSNLIKAIDPVLDLGLPGGVDIDAFEFTLLPDSIQPFNPQASQFALLFSVDVDDPLTADDESGGLEPAAIYASTLNGSYFELTPGHVFDENVDAISLFEHPLDGTQSIPTGSAENLIDDLRGDMKIYPNPVQAGSQLFLDLPVDGSYQMALFDIGGRNLAMSPARVLTEGQHTQALSDWFTGIRSLSAGIYVMELRLGGQAFMSLKFVKQ